MVIRPYEAAQWVGGDIVEDFCAATGIAPLGAASASPNESLGPTQLYIKLCLNRVGFDKGENERVLRLLLEVCPEEPARGCIYVHRGLYRDFRSAWIQVNKRLSEKYLDGAPLFTNPIPPPEKMSLYQPELALILQYLLALFEHFDTARLHPHRSLFARAMLLILAEKDLWDEFGERRCKSLMEWL